MDGVLLNVYHASLFLSRFRKPSCCNNKKNHNLKHLPFYHIHLPSPAFGSLPNLDFLIKHAEHMKSLANSF